MIQSWSTIRLWLALSVFSLAALGAYGWNFAMTPSFLNALVLLFWLVAWYVGQRSALPLSALPDRRVLYVALFLVSAALFGGAMFGAQVGQALGRLATEVFGAADIGLPFMALSGEIIAHLRSCRRLLRVALAQRRAGLSGVGDEPDLEALWRLVEAEYALQLRSPLEAATPRRLPIRVIVSSWPVDDHLRRSLEAVEDLAWRPLDVEL
jgi:hypothetical protein